MRVTALALTAILAICAVDPAFAAKKKSKPVETSSDQTTSTSFQSSGCGIAGCYRSGSQKIQHHHHKSS